MTAPYVAADDPVLREFNDTLRRMGYVQEAKPADKSDLPRAEIDWLDFSDLVQRDGCVPSTGKIGALRYPVTVSHGPPVIVEVDCDDAKVVRGAGQVRHERSIGRANKHGNTGDHSLSEHTIGVCGEYCVAAYLGFQGFAPHVDVFRSKADIGANIEVRTRSQIDYDLLVRSDARDNDIYVHVYATVADYPIGLARAQLHGWIRAKDAKQERYKAKHGGREAAFFVPTVELRPMSELLQLRQAKVSQ